ncbi:hypothetical protein AA313_de0209721 [Arthrobotrys entomopaga]|nr:hypothetical protein AA313_de0209721 [Arthrobotrys entomopaga]
MKSQSSSEKAVPTPPATSSEGSDTSKTSTKNPILRAISDRVVIPLIALGLSTPVISHAICLVGSRILKYKMDHELFDHTHRSISIDGNFDPNSGIGLSKEEEKARKAEMKTLFKSRKDAAKLEREYLRKERALMRKMKKEQARKLRKKGQNPSAQMDATTDMASDECSPKQQAIPAAQPSAYRQFMDKMKEKYNRNLKKSRKLGLFLGIGWWGNY